MPDVIFTGPAGRLEGRYQPSKQPQAPVALVLHPHPLYGGSMNNKVVHHLFHSFVRRGFSTLRFNFRGVGRSEGKFDGGPGEMSDAASALDWLQTFNPNAPYFWIAGFSFGSWISMQLLMRRPEIAGFITVAPPASMYDFTFLAPCPSSGVIIHGTADQVVPEAAAAKLAERLTNQRGITVDYVPIEGANHFFESKIEELGVAVDAYLDKRLSKAAAE